MQTQKKALFAMMDLFSLWIIINLLAIFVFIFWTFAGTLKEDTLPSHSSAVVWALTSVRSANVIVAADQVLSFKEK